MATFTQTFPANLRSGSPASLENRGLPSLPDRRPYLVPIPPRKPAVSTRKYLALFPHESEDARLTGATRSLYRRLLALNLPRVEAQTDATYDLRKFSEMRKTPLVSKASPKIA
ncbi:hypothetical protein [Tunturiibacter lichenicola]|uniref:hypothetical protein n=1 Tax=Tunturiibacter lichenicola TaxID=2051959 RepID=UPI0021B4B015|nr:hypothetical protein [Edaphobacter lichenicola]